MFEFRSIASETCVIGDGPLRLVLREKNSCLPPLPSGIGSDILDHSMVHILTQTNVDE